MSLFDKVLGTKKPEEKFHEETEYKKPIGKATIVEDKPEEDYFPSELQDDKASQ